MSTAVKLRPRGNGSPFEALVREAAAVALELRELDSLAGRKLCAAAYVREATEAAGTDAARLKELREQIDAGASRGMRAVASALRLMVLAVRSPNYPAPPRMANRLRHMTTPDSTAELARLRASPCDLFALAAQIAAERHPEDFGQAEASDAHAARLLELTLRRDQLYQRIGAEFTPADLEIGPWRGPDRGCRVAFKLTSGEIEIGPAQDAPERLVNWLLAHEQAKAT